jgi:crossover junction endodeoxyribonuclease RuvC
MHYIGIDPGLSGGIAYTNEKGYMVSFPMPVLSIGGKKEIDIKTLTIWFKNNSYACKMVGIEIQHAMPKQGVTSMFKIGKGYGILLGILNALNIPFAELRANEWQKEMFKGQPKGNTKDLSKKIAQQLYPTLDFKATARCTNIHDGMTDACLIATYIKQKYS